MMYERVETQLEVVFYNYLNAKKNFQNKPSKVNKVEFEKQTAIHQNTIHIMKLFGVTVEDMSKVYEECEKIVYFTK